jgi:hypothetical protein
MKNLLMAFVMLFGSAALADSVDVKSFNYDGTSEIANLLLNTEKTRTEYRQVRVPATCYRTTYRRQCHTQGRQCRTRCDRNRRNCRQVCTGGRRVCRDVPVRTPYTCYRYENRPYQVHDYDVITNATLNFDSSEVDGGADETFEVRVQGEADDLSVQDSKNYAVILKNKDRSEIRRTGLKEVNVSYDISFVKTKRMNEVLSAGIQNVVYRNGILNFSVGKNFNTQEFTQNIQIYRWRRFGTDPVLLDKDISENEMEVTANGDQSRVSINLRNLGITLPSKMRVIMKTSYNLGTGVLLNKNLKTEASANWIFR